MASDPINAESPKNFTIRLDMEIWNYAKVQSYDKVGYLDTQTEASLISSELSDFLGHERKQYNGRNITAAGNNEIVPQGQIDVFFSWKGSPRTKLHKETFLVIDSPPYDIVLGRAFLDTYQAYMYKGVLLPLALKPASENM
ncbi:hypothetical protein F5B17DRAFT_419572 [Nemania serpens]|nr:hypothetical protein F5B17DRAFT_419572 [Nemania serpens]